MKPDGYRLNRRESEDMSSVYSCVSKNAPGVLIIGEVKELISVAEGKPTSPQQFTVRDEVCSLGVNGGGPEPDDLCLARLKPDESWVEDRTVADCKSLGRAGYRGESPIELGNSRFRVNYS